MQKSIEKAKITKQQKKGLHLNKWFLDFVSEDGEAMIFYAAKLKWAGITVPYTSWIKYNPTTGTSQKSKFRNIYLPEKENGMIHWQDTRFGIYGKWEPLADPLQARLFDSEEGFLDWHCLQPASNVQLMIDGKMHKGRGYVEQLTLTADPWKIPMDELRWGRFGSPGYYLVWIELRKSDKKQWAWFNGQKVDKIVIEDHKIILPEMAISLELDQSAVLESEKKIHQVMNNLIRHVPGFNKNMPLNFLMADEHKWLSKGFLKKDDATIAEGRAIHELINFKSLDQ